MTDMRGGRQCLPKRKGLGEGHQRNVTNSKKKRVPELVPSQNRIMKKTIERQTGFEPATCGLGSRRSAN